jgi:putative alpha-1,2-mannosidase
MGHDVAARFEQRAGNWRDAFDPGTGFMRGRNRGGFRASLDSTASGYGADCTEDNAW